MVTYLEEIAPCSQSAVTGRECLRLSYGKLTVNSPDILGNKWLYEKCSEVKDYSKLLTELLTVTLRYPYGSLRNCSDSSTYKKSLVALVTTLLVTGGNTLLVTGPLHHWEPALEAKALLPAICTYGYLTGSLRLIRQCVFGKERTCGNCSEVEA